MNEHERLGRKYGVYGFYYWHDLCYSDRYKEEDWKKFIEQTSHNEVCRNKGIDIDTIRPTVSELFKEISEKNNQIQGEYDKIGNHYFMEYLDRNMNLIMGLFISGWVWMILSIVFYLLLLNIEITKNLNNNAKQIKSN